MYLNVMEWSPEPGTVWAEAGATVMASITIIRATTLNNTNMRVFMCYAFPKGSHGYTIHKGPALLYPMTRREADEGVLH